MATLAPPSASSQSLAQEEKGLMAPLYPMPRLKLVSGKGCWVVDGDGREYLDFTSGIAVNALGHAPKGLTRCVAQQMRALVHCSNYFANQPAIELARLLCETTGYPRVFFCNSGTEGVEAALKFARLRGRMLGLTGMDVLAFHGGFHGRTAFALSATAKEAYREPFAPLIDGVHFAAPDKPEELDGLPWDHISTVVIEPVQGEAGANVVSSEFLRALRERADAVNAALIFDEVQCGMGRCGSLLASEQAGVRADYVVMSKALAGGLPMGAVLMSEEASHHLAPGLHGSTFGGGPVVASAANFVVRSVLKPGFLERVRRRGKQLKTALTGLAERRSSLAGIHGVGLLQALSLDPDAGFDAETLLRSVRKQGLLLVSSGKDRVRFLPPLTVRKGEISEAIERFETALTELELAKGKAK